jgi:hypothetical protein
MAKISAKLSLNVPAITALCKGEPGSSILNDTTAPSILSGNDGDFYINTTTYQIYGPKAGTWGTPTQLSNNFLAPKWNSSYDTLSALSGAWDSSYSTVYSNSARWSGVFSTTRAYSGDWNDAYNTANNVYSLVNSESAGWGVTSNVYTTVNTNSGNWNAAYTAIVDEGDQWRSTYSSVYANSAAWSATADFGVRALTGNWENTYSIVYAKSALWDAAAGSAGADLAVRSLTGDWKNTHLAVYPNSGRWESVYTGFNSQSANNMDVFSIVFAGSAAWNDTNSTVWSNSGSWGSAINTARYDDTYTTVYDMSGNWESTYQQVTNDSQGWYDTTSTVAANSATWQSATLTFACSDETTDLTALANAITFRMPHNMTLTDVRASVSTAPVGSTIIVDVNQNGSSIFSTNVSIDANEKTSTTAAVPPVIVTSILTDDAEITVDIDQIGSTTAGKGLKVTLIGYK